MTEVGAARTMSLGPAGELGAETLVPAALVLVICLAIIAANVAIIATIVSMSGERCGGVRVGPGGGCF